MALRKSSSQAATLRLRRRASEMTSCKFESRRLSHAGICHRRPSNELGTRDEWRIAQPDRPTPKRERSISFCNERTFARSPDCDALKIRIRRLRTERLARRQSTAFYGERKRSFVGQHFRARGYFVSMVGRDEAMIRADIKNQEQEDQRLEPSNLWLTATVRWPTSKRPRQRSQKPPGAAKSMKPPVLPGGLTKASRAGSARPRRSR